MYLRGMEIAYIIFSKSMKRKGDLIKWNLKKVTFMEHTE